MGDAVNSRTEFARQCHWNIFCTQPERVGLSQKQIEDGITCSSDYKLPLASRNPRAKMMGTG
jgi:hypothetical protein